MRNVKSFCHISSNECGLEQVEIEFEKSFLDLLLIRNPPKLIAIKFFGQWLNKSTRLPVSLGEETLIDGQIFMMNVSDFISKRVSS